MGGAVYIYDEIFLFVPIIVVHASRSTFQIRVIGPSNTKLVVAGFATPSRSFAEFNQHLSMGLHGHMAVWW